VKDGLCIAVFHLTASSCIWTSSR